MTDVAAILKRVSRLKSERARHDTVYRQCFEYSFPLRAHGFGGQEYDASSGQTKRAKLLDTTLTDAALIAASNVHTGLTPSSSQWFGLDVNGANESDKQWLDEAAKTIFRHIHASNFDAEGFEAVIDAVCAGYFVLYVDEDRERGGYHFQQWPLSQCYITASKPGKPVDTVFREYTLSATQAIAEFGEQNVSEKIRKAAIEKPDESFTFVHAIYPRQIYVVGGKLARNLPIASCQIEVGEKRVVRESGYHEMPVVVPRWMRIHSATEYGVGPVWNALPDAKELNELVFKEKAATDLAVSGMWIAEDDGVLNPRAVTVGARKVIVANSVDSMKPLLTGSDFKVGFTIKEQLQAQIRRVMMADQLPPMDGPARTATEFHMRLDLIRRLLGPVFGRFQAEYLQPLIERCFGIALRAGALGQPPESLQNRRFTVTYISPMARAQRMEEVAAIERFNANVATIAQIDGEVLDTIDFDEQARILADALGVPAKAMRDKDEVAARRDQRAQQQQAQQQMAVMAPVAQQAAIKAVGA